MCILCDRLLGHWSVYFGLPAWLRLVVLQEKIYVMRSTVQYPELVQTSRVTPVVLKRPNGGVTAIAIDVDYLLRPTVVQLLCGLIRKNME